MLGLFVSIAAESRNDAGESSLVDVISPFKDKVTKDSGYVENYACLQAALYPLIS
jgi:hypothetical protein